MKSASQPLATSLRQGGKRTKGEEEKLGMAEA